MDTSTTLIENLTSSGEDAGSERQPSQLGLVIAWSSAEPHRIGEVGLVPDDGRRWILGRGADGADRIDFWRQRPGWNGPTPPLGGRGVSRQQLELRSSGGRLEVRSIGRCPLWVDEVALPGAVVQPGATLRLGNQLVLLVCQRPAMLPAGVHVPWSFTFGEPDPVGLIGESPAIWALRERLAFAARAPEHVLILGPSGSGKEMVASAVHRMSPRATGPYVARSAPTLPPGLIDAELFGNARNFPNPGMSERPGLIGHADGGTLFLDEVGELPAEQQAHLLRVLDSGGEYHRLGEPAARRSRLRLVTATNRQIGALKHDFAARLTLRLNVPPLAERREDIPLLLRYLARRSADTSPELAQRFVEERLTVTGDPWAGVRMDPTLVAALLRYSFPNNVRELMAILWEAMAGSPGDQIALTDDVRRRLADDRPYSTRPLEPPLGPPAPTEVIDTAPRSPPRAAAPTAEEVKHALQAAGGNVTEAARALRLTTRFKLLRLLDKYGIDVDTFRGKD